MRKFVNELSNRELLLADRIILHDSVHTTFIQNMSTRLDYGITKMGLDTISITPVYCSTIDKHTCVERLNSKPDEYFLIFDEHHLELLSSMNFLFYMFGQNDLKYPLLLMVMEKAMNTPIKRLTMTTAILLSEKSLLDGNATRAISFMEVYKQNKIVSMDFQGIEGEGDLNCFLLKERKVKIAQGLIMNYYVFHELAHIKNHCDKEALAMYKSLIEQTTGLLARDSTYSRYIESLPKDDVACDAYSLDLLFNFMYEQSNDYHFEFMVDSFISAVANLTIMDSVIDHGDHVNDWYTICWLRIITALNVVGLLKATRDGDTAFIGHIQDRITYGHITFKNYRETVEKVIYELKDRFDDVSERYPTQSCEWKKEVASVLETITSIS